MNINLEGLWHHSLVTGTRGLFSLTAGPLKRAVLLGRYQKTRGAGFGVTLCKVQGYYWSCFFEFLLHARTYIYVTYNPHSSARQALFTQFIDSYPRTQSS